MTQPFPDNPFLSGPTAPSGIECDAPDLIIEGELPADLQGVYFRNGPITAHAKIDHKTGEMVFFVARPRVPSVTICA